MLNLSSQLPLRTRKKQIFTCRKEKTSHPGQFCVQRGSTIPRPLLDAAQLLSSHHRLHTSMAHHRRADWGTTHGKTAMRVWWLKGAIFAHLVDPTLNRGGGWRLQLELCWDPSPEVLRSFAPSSTGWPPTTTSLTLSYVLLFTMKPSWTQGKARSALGIT